MKETEEKQFNQTQKSKVKNPNLGLHLIALILIAITMISSSIGLYAWARYTSTQSENATAQIAKWYFNLKTGQATIDGNTRTLLHLTRTDDRSHVEEGKLAPGTYGLLPIIVDTTDTETDLTYDVLITINNCPQNMVFTPKTPASTTQTVTGEGTAQSPRVRTIRIQKYVPWSQTGEHDETISWDWPYETGTGNAISANDDIDTADSGKEVTVTISAVGTEVLSRPVSMATIIDKNDNVINNGGTITLKVEDDEKKTNQLRISSEKTENVTFSSSDDTVATVANDGTVTAVAAGSAVITITGTTSGETFTVNVTVKPKLTINVGDTIYYNPTGTYNWNKNLATSDFTGTDEEAIQTMTTGDGGTHNITTWKVLNVDNNTGAIDMVPANPSATVRLQGAQGYNNAVKLLNEACSSLYSDSSKEITARSINIEDIETAVKAGGSVRVDALNTAKTNYGVGTKQDANLYSKSNSKYPTIYEREELNVIKPDVTVEDGKDANLSQSEQTQFITKTESSSINGYKQAGTSIQPYQTYYYLNWGSTAKENLLKKNYWVASRCVSLNGSYCNFRVHCANSSFVSANYMFGSYGDANDNSFGLFPVVSLNSSVLSLKSGTANQYNVD